MSEYRWVDLEAHPKSEVPGIERVCFGYVLRNDVWKFIYEVFGDTEQLAIPKFTHLERGDELWKASCFELFIGSDSHNYRELNFSPDGRYAAYDFQAYRSGRSSLRGSVVAKMESWRDAKRYRIDIQLDDNARPDSAIHLGPAAILFDKQGRQSWWAWQHNNLEQADFHHPPSWHIPLR